MKRNLRKWNLLLLVLAFATLMSMTVFAKAPKAPTISKTVKIPAEIQVFRDDEQPRFILGHYASGITLPIKNLKKDAVMTDYNGFKNGYMFTKKYEIAIYKWDATAKLFTSMSWYDSNQKRYDVGIPVKFRIKQNKKNYADCKMKLHT